MRKRRKIKIESVPVFAFVVDGKTEVWYLQMLKRNEQNSRNVQVRIKPEIPQKKSIKEQYNLAISLSEQEFTQVFWMLDLDNLIKESKETPRGKKTALQLFDECRKDCEQKYQNIILITINPCLEFWFLLHFIKTSKSIDKCSEAES